MQAMKTVAADDCVDQVLLFIVDILNTESTLLVPNPAVAAIAEASFAGNIKDDCLILPGVVSRKKQILPQLTV